MSAELIPDPTDSIPPTPLSEWIDSPEQRRGDIIKSVVLLPAAVIGSVIAGAAVYLETGDKPFFVQPREGTNGDRFKLLKVRSHKGNRDYNEPSPGLDDERLSRTGKSIRKHHIDELPQILNILKGDIAFVGPRPIIDRELTMMRSSLSADEFESWYSLFRTAKKGWISPWALMGDNYEPGSVAAMRARIHWDKLYMQHADRGFQNRVIWESFMGVIRKRLQLGNMPFATPVDCIPINSPLDGFHSKVYRLNGQVVKLSKQSYDTDSVVKKATDLRDEHTLTQSYLGEYVPPTSFAVVDSGEPGKAKIATVQEFVDGVRVADIKDPNREGLKEQLAGFYALCLSMYKETGVVVDIFGRPTSLGWFNPDHSSNILVTHVGGELKPMLVDTTQSLLLRNPFISRIAKPILAAMLKRRVKQLKPNLTLARDSTKAR